MRVAPMPDLARIPSQRVSLTDNRTGMTERSWYLFFLSLFNFISIANTGTPTVSTGDITVGAGSWYINNKVGSTCIMTLPVASTSPGRQITVKNMQPQLVNSASGDVAPIDSLVPGNTILLDVVGNWATLVSDGTNWVVMQCGTNNSLLLE
jgi:hypothetical protein